MLVLGLGGVGSSCAEALARGGVGSLVVLDEDVVEPSKINRQTLAFVSTVGRVKAEVMAEMISDINPDCRVVRRECRHRGFSGLEVLFADERPVEIAGEGRTKAQTLGSMSYLPPIMGQMLAGLAIRRLAGLEPMAAPPSLSPPD